MTVKQNLGIIFGGRSGEHEVSLMSARSVLSVIDRSRYQVYPIAISRGGAWFWGDNALEMLEAGTPEALSSAALFPDVTRRGLYTIRQEQGRDVLEKVVDLDILFPVLHGTYGEDGTLQGMLEMADVAYVGAGVLGSAVGMDKALFKDVMLANRIPVVDSILVSRAEIQHDIQEVIEKTEQHFAYPIFVKPANLGSSVGVSKCRTRSDLYEGLMEAAQFDRRILIERGINGREIEISVLGNETPRASLPGEIRPQADFYSYDAKYILDNSELIIPAKLDDKTVKSIQEYSIRAYRAADCAGMARVDFLVDKTSNEIYLNEINTIPGFTKISMYPKLWEASGIPYSNLIDQLINLARERKADRDATKRDYRRGA